MAARVRLLYCGRVRGPLPGNWSSFRPGGGGFRCLRPAGRLLGYRGDTALTPEYYCWNCLRRCHLLIFTCLNWTKGHDYLSLCR